MKPFVFQYAPTFGVILGAITLFWPYFSPPERTQPEPIQVATLAPGLLRPKIVETPDRDPFGMADPEPAATKLAANAKAAQKTSVPTAQAKAAAKAATKIAEAAKAVPIDPIRDKLSKLSLGAISIHGDRSIAVIEGRVYEKGDTIQGTSSELGSAVLADIQPQKVVLRVGTMDVAIAFSDTHTARNRPAPSMSAPLASNTAARRPATRTNTNTRIRPR